MKLYLVFAVSCLALFGTVGCASNPSKKPTGDNVVVKTLTLSKNVVNDAAGLPKARPGKFVLHTDYLSVSTPYGGHGALVSCPQIAADIHKINALIGPEIQPKQDDLDITEENTGSIGEFATDLRKNLSDVVRNAAGGVLGNFNPIHPLIRILSRASKIEEEAREEIVLLRLQRAWLNAKFTSHVCDQSLIVKDIDMDTPQQTARKDRPLP